MPELPEVQTVVDGLNKKIKNKKISSVWTDYKSDFYLGKDSIKDPKYFKEFSKKVIKTKVLKAERRAKNIQIHLSNGETILNDLQNATQKTQYRATWTQLKVGLDLMSSGRVNSSLTTR